MLRVSLPKCGLCPWDLWEQENGKGSASLQFGFTRLRLGSVVNKPGQPVAESLRVHFSYFFALFGRTVRAMRRPTLAAVAHTASTTFINSYGTTKKTALRLHTMLLIRTTIESIHMEPPIDSPNKPALRSWPGFLGPALSVASRTIYLSASLAAGARQALRSVIATVTTFDFLVAFASYTRLCSHICSSCWMACVPLSAGQQPRY